MHALVACRDDAPARVRDAAFPGGDDAAGTGDDRHEREDVIRLELDIDHQIDMARWGLGVKYPTKISAIGGHFMFDDDQETPNTLTATFEFGQGGFDRLACGLRQTRDAEEFLGVELRLAMDDVVALFRKPSHQASRLFAVHELERARRLAVLR